MQVTACYRPNRRRAGVPLPGVVDVEPTKQIATARGWRRTLTDSAPSMSTPGSACDNASDGGERPQASGTDRGRLPGTTGCVDDVPVDLFDEFVDRLVMVVLVCR
jgi:hypothetical protein